AELKRRDQDEVELAERVRNARVGFEPAQRARVQVEDRVLVARDLLRIGFAMKHPERAAGARRRLDLEFARGKRKEIRRQRLRLIEDVAGPSRSGGAARLLAVRHG